MGITGLLPLMKNASSEVSLSKLRDNVAAVDTNVWIHRACYSCADKIYLNEATDLYVNYCIKNCQLLREHNITPILVFDGQSLPAKSETKLERKKRKEQIREQVEELLRKGQESQARWLMRQCVDVTFEMIYKVIERCRLENIDYIVSPYEADAQITYLVNNGIADFAITEDSDLLAFGCRRALYKLDRETKRGHLIDLDRLEKCFKNFDFKKFQYMCILSGCDYLANIPNVGIGRSRKFFESLTTSNLDDIAQLLKLLPIALKMADKIKVTKEYIEDFIRAVNTFNHQLVYSPLLKDFTHLNGLKKGLQHEHLKAYAGDFFDPKRKSTNELSFVANYVMGNVCPKTLEILDNLHIDCSKCPNDRSAHFFSTIIQDRIDSRGNSSHKLFDPNQILQKAGQKKKIEEDDIPVYQETAGKSSPQNQSENASFTKLKTAQIKPTRPTRNMFRKMEKIPNNNGQGSKKSKYFRQKNDPISDHSFDETEFSDFLPETKRHKSDLNQSASSIDEDECIILSELNRSQKLTRSGSLSSTQNSQSTFDSPFSSGTSQQSWKTINSILTSTPPSSSSTPKNNEKKKKMATVSTTKLLRSKKSNPRSQSKDIRNYFSK